MDASTQREPEINKLFRMARKYEASDLYLRVGSPPLIKLRGAIQQAEMRPLSQEDLECLIPPILYAEQWQLVGEGKGVAFVYAFDEGDVYHVKVSSNDGRLRLSAHWRGIIGMKR
jgi:twitching motility protein PilT